ncbi:MAG TPA: DUF2066 domain-containing protein [Pseudomonadales bacterium]
MKKRFAMMGVLVWLMSAVAAWAEVPPGLYSVKVPVADQSAATLKQATREGLSRVLTRLSGQSDWSAYPGVPPYLAQAERFVAQFSYEKAPPPADASVAVLPFILTLQFATGATDRVVRQAGLPVWPVNRPPVLVWWVVQDQSMVRRMTREQDALWFSSIESAAADRGVPLQWPLNDLDDRLNLDSDALWQLNEEAIRKASARYNSTWIVAGRFVQSSEGRWLGNWMLLGEGFPQVLEVEADSEETAVATLVALVADALSQRYAIVPQGGMEGSASLVIDGVQSFADYMAVRRLLESLASVVSVSPEAVKGDQVHYRLVLRGERATVVDELRLRSEVDVLPEQQDSAVNPALMLFWRGGL